MDNLNRSFKKFDFWSNVFYVFSAVFVSGALLGMFGKLTPMMATLGYLFALLFLFISRGYRGYARAMRDNQNRLIQEIEIVVAEQEKKNNE